MTTSDERVIEIRSEVFLLGLEINSFLAKRGTSKYAAMMAMGALLGFELGENPSTKDMCEQIMHMCRLILTARIEFEKEKGLIHDPEAN